MANRAFDQTIINVREKPLSSDINQGFSTVYRSVREKWRREVAHRTANGVTTASSHAALAFVGDGFQVQPLSVPAMSVQVIDGIGLAWAPGATATDINGALSCDDREDAKPIALDATQTIAVPAADAVNPRIDIVEVQYRRQVGNPLSRLVLDIGTRRFVPGLVNKLLTWALGDLVPTVNGAGAINYKTGTPAGVPVAPATTAGYTKIAEVQVGAAVASIVEGKVVDLRKNLAPGGVMTAAVSCNFNAATGVLGDVSIIAPPGWTAVVVGYLNYLALGTPAVELYLFPAGNGSGLPPSVTASATAGGAGTVNSQVVSLAASYGPNATASLAAAGVSRFPNPPPALAVGAPSIFAAAVLRQWTGAAFAAPVAPNMVVSFNVVLPVG